MKKKIYVGHLVTRELLKQNVTKVSIFFSGSIYYIEKLQKVLIYIQLLKAISLVSLTSAVVEVWFSELFKLK